MDETQKIINPTVDSILQNWDKLGNIYNQLDSAPQTFYFSLIHILRLHQARSILEVACGRCILLPYCLQIKNPDAQYLGVDISPKMVKLGEEFLKSHFEKYDSKLNFQEWMEKSKLKIKVANGQEPINEGKKFDRIICNMVLMLTEDPQRMLRNLHDEAEEGCLMGVSIWGNPAQNNFLNLVGNSISELGLQIPKMRSSFHLYQKVGLLAEKTGWQVIVRWQQNSNFPFTSVDEVKEYAKISTDKLKTQNEEQKKAVYDLFLEKVRKTFQEKKGLVFSAQLYVLRKK